MTQKISSHFSIPQWKMIHLVFGWNLVRNILYVVLATLTLGISLFVSFEKGYLSASSAKNVFGITFLVGLTMFWIATTIFYYRRILIKYLRYQKKFYGNMYAEISAKSKFGEENTYVDLYKARYNFFSHQLNVELKKSKIVRLKKIPNHPILKKKEQEEFVTGI